MSWIDTPLVQDAKSDLSRFRKMLDSLPGPLGKTTSVEACGKAFVKGIERRKATSTAPTTLRSCVGSNRCSSTRLGEAGTLKTVPELLPQMDAEVEALGRSLSARTKEVEK